MARFEDGDIVTVYLVINRGAGLRSKDRAGIQAWSFAKDMADFYLTFHNCKHFSLKTYRGTIEEINNIIEANYHSEIGFYNIKTVDREHPDSHEMKILQAPMTQAEASNLYAECQNFLHNDIDYRLLQEAIDYMEPDARKVMNAIGLTDIVRFMIHNKHSRFVKSIELDQLTVLARISPEHFGE